VSDAPAAVPDERVRIWDWPTRIFHWSIVALIPALWWTAENGRIELHMQLGLVMLALVLFRLIWGLIGSSTARFSNFLKGPRGVVSYLNGRAAHAVGHNPLGGWSVALMLLVLGAQVGLGLFATNEDGDLFGPLALLVSGETSETLTERHETLFNILLGLILLHLLAIAVYAAKLQNLVGPMLTGSGELPSGTAPMRAAPLWRLALAVALAAGAALWLWARL
jgi:cytochrome b